MANYDNLKESVSDAIKTNGNNEITGALLQNTLLTIINTLGKNATFAGMAFLSTNPGTPDGNVFYLARDFGTYNNFRTPSNSVPPNAPLVNDGTKIMFFYNSGDGWKNWSVAVPSSLGEVTPSTVFADELVPNGSVAFAKTPGTYKIFGNATLASNEVCVFTKSKDVWKQMKFSVGGGGTGGGIGEAPNDGKAYARRSTEWVSIEQTDEYKVLATKNEVNEARTAIISLTKDVQGGILTAKIENYNLFDASYLNTCKFFLMRRVKRSRKKGLINGIREERKKYGTRWANTGVGILNNQINGGDHVNWPEYSYMWTPTGDKTVLFNGLNIFNISSWPNIGLKSFLRVSGAKKPRDYVPFYLDKIIGLEGAQYTEKVFYEFNKHARKAEIGIALYAPVDSNIGGGWQRISNIAKIVARTPGRISIIG